MSRSASAPSSGAPPSDLEIGVLAQHLSSSIGPIGVDLGTRAIKMLQVRDRFDVPHVMAAAPVELTGPVGDGADPLLADRLRSALARGGFSGRTCVVSLPRTDVSLQTMRLPSMPDDELLEAVARAATRRSGLHRDALEIECIPTGTCVHGGERRDEILVATARREIIGKRLAPLLAAGIKPVARELAVAALARRFARRSRSGWVHAIVDVGASGSTVLVLRGERIALCRSIPIGGDHLDGAVAAHLRVDARAAADLRAERIDADRGAMPPVDGATARAVYESVRPLMADLAKEIMLHLRHYAVTFRGPGPERITLTGGDGLEPSLDVMVSRACDLPVLLDDEWGPPASRWATAAGLSLCHLGCAAIREGRLRQAA